MNMETAEQQLLITEEQIIGPVFEILEQVTPTELTRTQEVPQSITQSLDALFPEQRHEEKTIQKAKTTLGNVANEFTAGQLRDVITEVQFLADSWLDDFEREIFRGLTLKELIHEKGSL